MPTNRSSRWRSERGGADWLMDAQGRLIGFRDELGNEYAIPSVPVPNGFGEDDELTRALSAAMQFKLENSEYPWAQLPHPATRMGDTVIVPDVGPYGTFMRATGNMWVPTAPASLVARPDASISAVDNTTNPQVQMAVTLQAAALWGGRGLLGTTGCVEITPLWNSANDGVNKDMWVRINGGAPFYVKTRNNNESESARLLIQSRKPANQNNLLVMGRANGGYGSSTSEDTTTVAVNSDTTPVTIEVGVTWSTLGTGTRDCPLVSCGMVLYP